MSLAGSQLGTWPATQACALTGNRTGNPLVCRLSHTSRDLLDIFNSTSNGEGRPYATTWRPLCLARMTPTLCRFPGCYLISLCSGPSISQAPTRLSSLWVSPSGSFTASALTGPPASVLGLQGDTVDLPPCSSWKAAGLLFPFPDLQVNGGFFLRKRK